MSPEREAAVHFLQEEIRLYRAALAAVRRGRDMADAGVRGNVTPSDLEALLEDARQLLARLTYKRGPDGIALAGLEERTGAQDASPVTDAHAGSCRCAGETNAAGIAACQAGAGGSERRAVWVVE